ncbi:MAG: hypothetical protein K7J15_05700, partial [Candidatus Regiella insecticola]|nr:hypothetical protein [Candidatus Regiella insecticola]
FYIWLAFRVIIYSHKSLLLAEDEIYYNYNNNNNNNNVILYNIIPNLTHNYCTPPTALME